MTKSLYPSSIKHAALHYINVVYNDSCHVYTDGSRLANGGAAAAATVNTHPTHHPKYADEIQVKLIDGVSNFTCELYAIYVALDRIRDLKSSPHTRDTVPHIAAIFTDSKSSIQALQEKPKSNFDLQHKIHERIHDIQTKGTDIHLVHIPSHVGIPGNEYVDKLAVAKAEVSMSLPLNNAVTGEDSDHSNDEEINFVQVPFSKRHVYTIIETKAKQQLPSYKNLRPLTLPNIPFANRQIYYVLRTKAYRYHRLRNAGLPVKCECGEDFTLKHMLSSCMHHVGIRTSILLVLHRYQLTSLEQALDPPKRVGLKPILRIVDLLAESSIAGLL